MEGRKGGRGRLLGPEVLVLQLLGLWRPRQSGGDRAADLRAYLALALVAAIPAGAVLRLCADFPQQLEELALCCFILFITIGSLIKGAFFIGEGKMLRELVHLLDTTREQYGISGSSESIRNRYKRMVDRLYIYFQVMSITAVILWSGNPLLSSGNEEEKQGHLRQLPTPLWLPVNVHSSPMYEMLYIIQTASLTIASEAAICLDVFFVRLMMLVAAEIEVLNQSLSTMHNLHFKSTVSEDDLHGVGGRDQPWVVPGSGQPSADKSSEKVSDKEMFSTIVKNVLHHQTILRSISLLQTSMNVSTFIILFINMANLCFNVFVVAGLLQRDGNLTNAMKALFTVPSILFQTALYCIFGQITTDQSEKLSNSAFDCGWINCSSNFKRILLIFMTMAGKPVQITVGKTSQLSKEMLLQVLNGTYVLLNMFLQMRGKD